jgi:hypothetical protein
MQHKLPSHRRISRRKQATRTKRLELTFTRERVLSRRERNSQNFPIPHNTHIDRLSSREKKGRI